MSSRKHWSAADLETLRRDFANKRTADIAAALGRTYSATAQKATQLGLTKSAAYLASEAACRLRGDAGAACRFVKGQQPWNKGVKGSTGTQEACRAHHFKKGRPASDTNSWVPVGTVRVDKDGTPVRKVSDDVSLPRRLRWVPVPRLVWIEAHGAIPDGMTVVFKPGRKTSVETDITADALELVSRAELMRRNSYHRYGQEISSLVQLRGAISRQINKRAKEAATS
jgi:hypothetical protein